MKYLFGREHLLINSGFKQESNLWLSRAERQIGKANGSLGPNNMLAISRLPRAAMKVRRLTRSPRPHEQGAWAGCRGRALSRSADSLRSRISWPAQPEDRPASRP